MSLIWQEGVELTEKEKLENAHKEKVFNLVNERVNLTDKVS